MDFEKPPPQQVKGTEISFEAVPEILRLAEYYSIPLTWATCGEITVDTESRWRDIFKQISAARVKHEIASHTFHHKDISECSLKEAEAEIVKGIKALSGETKSFVFPKNRIEHLVILERLGILAYRGLQQQLGYPRKSCGVWNISQTYYLGRKSSTIKGLKLCLLLRLFVDLAIDYEGVLHVWSHPWHMSIDGNARKFMMVVLNPLFNHVRRKRDTGLLWTTTMRELAEYCETRENYV